MGNLFRETGRSFDLTRHVTIDATSNQLKDEELYITTEKKNEGICNSKVRRRKRMARGRKLIKPIHRSPGPSTLLCRKTELNTNIAKVPYKHSSSDRSVSTVRENLIKGGRIRRNAAMRYGLQKKKGCSRLGDGVQIESFLREGPKRCGE